MQSEERYANLRVLNSFAAQDPYYDLESEQADFLLADWFLNIGSDPAGNPFVEVLHGRHKGCLIGCLAPTVDAACALAFKAGVIDFIRTPST